MTTSVFTAGNSVSRRHFCVSAMKKSSHSRCQAPALFPRGRQIRDLTFLAAKLVTMPQKKRRPMAALRCASKAAYRHSAASGHAARQEAPHSEQPLGMVGRFTIIKVIVVNPPCTPSL
jgi:hypothetical protein